MIKKNCKYCQQEFEVPNWRVEAKYCNHECYENSREKYLVKCEYCKRRIKIIGNRYKKCEHKLFFCSNKCQGLYQTGDKNYNYDNHKVTGKNNGNYRGGQIRKCLNCDNMIWTKPCNLDRNNYCSWECKIKYEVGKNASGYINGKSKQPYTLDFNSDLKEKVRKRDDYQCKLCKINEKDYFQKLSIHHINYNKGNNLEDNLISLCRDCHQKTNKKLKRKYYEKYFKGVINYDNKLFSK